MADTFKIIGASVIMGVVAFAIQRYTDNNVVSLAIGIPAGLVVYIAALLALGSFGTQDLKFLKQVEGRVPAIFRRFYAAALGLVAIFVRQKPALP
jgi:hypothetical protein